jgi:GT2 family glycosyltransferase
MTSARCSIVIPVHNKAALTRQCLDAIYEHRPAVDHEILVVDDASTDRTAEMVAGYGDAVQHLRLDRNVGFATACNTGAAAAKGEYLVFLNNDTIAQPGWLDALVAYSAEHGVTAVGSKLLYPDGTVQHAGVAFSPLGDPLHIYAGFPADHPAVSKSRQFQAVTAACVLIRRDAFEEVGGFDTGYQNDLEDVDLCLRLGQSGHAVHYCHTSLLYHLESASRGQRNRPKHSARVYRERWGRCVRHDELVYYVEDGLLELLRAPNQLRKPWTRWRTEAHLVHTRMDQVLEMLRETARAAVYEGGNGDGGTSRRLTSRERRRIRKDIREAARDLARSVGDAPPAEEPRFAKPQTEVSEDEAHDETHEEGKEGEAAIAAEAPVSTPDAPKDTYEKLVEDIVATLDRVLPPDANVLVVSKGDDRLLQVPGRRCSHFPQDEGGGYLGYYPKTGGDALQLLETAQVAGAEFFVLPATAMWWLDQYPELAERLGQTQPVVDRPDLCLVFGLADNMLSDVVRSLLPENARLAVVAGRSGLGLRNVMLFPNDLSEDQAVKHVDRLTATGIQFLVVPRDAFGWLAAQPRLEEHLRTQHRFVTRQSHACEIYELVTTAESQDPEPARPEAASAAQ